jgi:hypothetical protein
MILDDRSGIVRKLFLNVVSGFSRRLTVNFEGDIIMPNVSAREMISESARFRRVLEQVKRVAPVDCSPLKRSVREVELRLYPRGTAGQ